MLRFACILAAVAVCQVQAANRYLLYTRANLHVPVDISISEDTLSELFRPELNTILLIHGHQQSANARFNLLTLEEILLRTPSNVIVVDWEKEASGSYFTAVSNVPSVAHDLSSFLNWLSSTPSPNNGPVKATVVVNISNVHLVGFGLGAHVAGIASRQLSDTAGIVGRITGLDPSGRQWGSESQRLRDTDAHYVEVIHTDGSGILANGIGTDIGQVNFYANGGGQQPGCLTHSCSHERAYEIFAASMRGHLFGRPCMTIQQVIWGNCGGVQLRVGGLELSKTSFSRIYAFNTGMNFPFIGHPS